MAELFRSPASGWVLRSLGHIPVARKSESARSSLTAALTHLGWGECVAIFPEGGISRDLEPRAGQTGAARLAGCSRALVVAVALCATRRVRAPGRRRRRLGPGPIPSAGGPPVLVGECEDRY